MNDAIMTKINLTHLLYLQIVQYYIIQQISNNL